MCFQAYCRWHSLPKDASCSKCSDKEGQCSTKHLNYLPVWTMTILHTMHYCSHPTTYSVILVNPSAITGLSQ